MFYNTCITEMSVGATKTILSAETKEEEEQVQQQLQLERRRSSSSTSFKHITHTFLSGKLSSTLIIPIQIARKYGIDQPSNVIVEERGEEGILIKKLEI